MNTLPLSLNLTGQPCLVVGGGRVALRKIETLEEAGAKLTIISPKLDKTVDRLVREKGIDYVQRPFEDADIGGKLFVVAATNDRNINRRVFAACEKQCVLINTVDDPELCTASFPSIVNRNPVTVAVSTGGTSPTLARRIRAQIETYLPSGIGALAVFLGDQRTWLRSFLPDPQIRRRLLDRVLDGNLPKLIENQAEEEAINLIKATTTSDNVNRGWVSLVGAGPGDPELLTLKAFRALQQADVVYYDNLVSEEVLRLCRRDAERVYVGKRGELAGRPQSEINQLLIESAQQGLRVVRLKGGDPFIFGRGGEEIETLSEHGVGFEVVPGITAALGCAAYAGIPLTHRNYADSVRFVTGQLKDDEINIDWPELARSNQTLVVYMGLVALRRLVDELLTHGADPTTPAALVSRGTLKDQIVVVAPLSSLAEKVEKANPPGPTTTIIGHVVSLRKESNPLD